MFKRRTMRGCRVSQGREDLLLSCRRRAATWVTLVGISEFAEAELVASAFAILRRPSSDSTQTNGMRRSRHCIVAIMTSPLATARKNRGVRLVNNLPGPNRTLGGTVFRVRSPYL